MTREEVEESLSKSELEAFDEWMTGQTVGIGDDGVTDYYDHDVARFVAMVRQGKRTYWD